MLLTDIVIDGIDGIDLALNIPLMLHILFLGLDHTRPIVRDHCKQLLLNLLVSVAFHSVAVIFNSFYTRFTCRLFWPITMIT